MGTVPKWMGALLAVLGVIGLVVASSERLACAEVRYSGGTMVDCESMTVFQPRVRADDEDSESEAQVSIPLPPWLMGVLGAMYHGNCETTEVPEGQWTVCDDGFSMVEREGASAAWALGLRPGEDRSRNARAAEVGDERDDVGAVLDCGPFACGEYWDGPENPEIRSYVDLLSERERAHLTARLRTWRSQEIDRDLVQARVGNTALHARLREMAAYEAEFERTEPFARVEPESVARPAAGR